MKHAFAHVWFATPAKYHSPLRWREWSDQGILEVAASRVEFSGKKTTLRFEKVRSVSVAPSRLPWLSLLLTDAVLVFMVVAGMFSFFTLDNPETFPELLALNVLVIVLVRRARWVCVDYIDETGQLQQAYFTDGGASGWGRFTRGVHQLASAIESIRDEGIPDATAEAEPPYRQVLAWSVINAARKACSVPASSGQFNPARTAVRISTCPATWTDQAEFEVQCVRSKKSSPVPPEVLRLPIRCGEVAARVASDALSYPQRSPPAAAQPPVAHIHRGAHA